jgi:hypothetical protein
MLLTVGGERPINNNFKPKSYLDDQLQKTLITSPSGMEEFLSQFSVMKL